MKEVSVSFLKDGNYKDYIKKINKTNADYIHFDVMDGKFVNNKNLTIKELTDLLKISTKRNDIHLMVANPEKYIEKLALFKIEYLTIHYEIKNLEYNLNAITNYGIKPGLAINPETDINKIKDILNSNKIKLILIMGVHPGRSGQEYIEETTEKINKLKKYIKENNLNIKIEVDGGVCEETLEHIKEADIIVSASYILNNYSNIDKIKNIV